jgi:hypothetical protein
MGVAAFFISGKFGGSVVDAGGWAGCRVYGAGGGPGAACKGRGAAAAPWMASQKAAEQARPRAPLGPWEAQNNWAAS